MYLFTIKQIMNPNFTNSDFLLMNNHLLTPQKFNDTIAYQILNSEPYCSYSLHSWYLPGWDISHLNKFKSTLELLSFYDEKYGIDKYNEKHNTILIK